MSDSCTGVPIDGGFGNPQHCDGCAKVSTLEARIAELERERDGWHRVYEGVALALGYAEQAEGQAGVRVASHQTVMNAIHNLQRDAAARADRDEAVRLLRRTKPVLDAVAALSDNTSPESMTATDIDAYLALHPAQPETPTKGPR